VTAASRTGRATPRVRTKRVHAPREASDGLRVLVMRLWPRGIRRTHVDRWLRDLGADRTDLRAYRAGAFGWPEMRRRYLAGLRRAPARTALQELCALARAGPVTLLCSCPDEARCHRELLRARLTR
jgi:uncharacterized protein YeaO (DUF488 family)